MQSHIPSAKQRQDWVNQLNLAKAISYREEQPAQQGQLGDIPSELRPELQAAAAELGYSRLYQHQIEAAMAALAGQDVVIATPTASGKSVAFHLPMITAALGKGPHRSLYLAPTKALINDQRGKFRDWAAALAAQDLDLLGATLTGDTPGDRAEIFRPTPQILLSTPDCVNALLYKARYPQFAGLKRFLRELRYVVLDEAHSYGGSFGTNMAGLVRRIRLAVVRAGGTWEQVQFILATATVGNPQELWQQLCGREPGHPLALILLNTAPFPGRTLLYTNGKMNQAKIAQLVSDLAQQGQTTILFVESRRLGRNMLHLIRQQFTRQGLPGQACAIFHGTLSPEKRQEIAREINRGRLKVIVATSALEQGVDFPQIDAAVCWGFPGVNRLRQRFGRAGRGSSPGLGIFIPRRGNSSDLYYARRGQELAAAAAEPVNIRADYGPRIEQHILAAAGESGIDLRTELLQLFGESGVRAAHRLVQAGKLSVYQGFLTAPHASALAIAMRGQQLDQVRLLEEGTKDEIEVMSHALAQREVYTGAIYSTLDDQGELRRWRVLDLDLKTKEAIAEPLDTESPYTTQPIQDLNVEMDESQSTRQRVVEVQPYSPWGSISLGLTLGWGKVQDVVIGYEELISRSKLICLNPDCRDHKVEVSSRYQECRSCGGPLILWKTSQEVVREVSFKQPLLLSYEAPVLQLVWEGEAASQALDYLAKQIREQLVQQYVEIPNWYEDILDMPPGLVGLHSLSHLLLNALPTQGHPIEASDLIRICLGEPGQILLFDDAPLGTGTVEYLYENLEEMLAPAYHLAAECSCETGCPRCCTSSHCNEKNVAIYRPLVEQMLGNRFSSGS